MVFCFVTCTFVDLLMDVLSPTRQLCLLSVKGHVSVLRTFLCLYVTDPGSLKEDEEFMFWWDSLFRVWVGVE